MLKRLLIALLTISVVAMLWPAASAQAQCYWTQGKDPSNPTTWCYWCPTGWYTVSGAWEDTGGYCAAWWAGSAFNGVEFKAPTSANTCAKDGDPSDCPTVISAVYGRQDIGLGCKENELDPNCGTNVLQLCCPPGHAGGTCEPPGDTSGWPGIYTGIVANTETTTDCTKRNCREVVEIPFLISCPNKNWGGRVIPYDFNGLTCLCPLGIEKDQGQYKCCVGRDKDGKCFEFGKSSATAMHCQDLDLPSHYVVGQTVTFGPEECTPLSYVVPDGLCEDLFTYLNPSR